MTSQANHQILNILSKCRAFSRIDSETLTWLAARAKLFTSEEGQTLLTNDRLPEYCYVLVDGRARILHRDTGTKLPITLAFSQPGDLIGWSSLVKRQSCEWVTSSTPLNLIGISASDFYHLEGQSKEFRDWLDSNNSPSELISALAPHFDRIPHSSKDNLSLLKELLPYISLIPARTDRQSSYLSSEKVILWNAIPPHSKAIRCGDFFNESYLPGISPDFALRLLSIDKTQWDHCFDYDKYTELLEDEPSPDLWGSGRYITTSAPEPQGQISESPSTHGGAYHKNKKVPISLGIGANEQTLACLDMLAKYYNIPFRRDVIERAVREQSFSSTPTLQTIGSLSTILGLVGSIANIPNNQLSRIPFPCIAILLDQPVVIHDITSSSIKCVAPEFGAINIPTSELVSDNLSVLILQPGRDAQNRKLGLSWFYPQIKKYRRSLGEVLLASLVLQLLNLAQPLVMQQIFDKVIVQQNLDTLYTLGLILLFVSLFQGLLGSVRTYLFADTTNRIDIALGSEVIQHLLRLPLKYFDSRPVGELQTRIAELGNIRSFLTGSLLTLSLDAVFSVIYVAVMLVYSGVLTAVTLGVIPLFLGLTFIASPFIRSQLRRAAEKNARTQAFLIESLNGVQTIKAQNAENSTRWQWQQRYASFMSESFKSLLIGVSSGTIGSFLTQLTGLLTLWVGAFLVIQGDLTIGQLIAFRIISGYVVGPLLNIATSWQSFQGVALSIERLSDVVDAKTESGDTDKDQLPLPLIEGAVTFDKVDFSFSEASPLVAKGVTFSVTPGSFVGIVGRSGSGKSTIMKLLPRLYIPTRGRILIDGYDITKVQLSSLRRQVGIVPQDSLLFDGTVADNISLVNPDVTSEDIVKAAKVACAHDFIMDLPEGYATKVVERGSNLSGGQRQRLAIARAIIQNPKLLILDEATSALDYLTERQVCSNLKSHFHGTTVFFITHRLSTIVSSDHILMMDKGHLVEEGTHSSLLDQKGRYFALFNQQASTLD